MKENPRFSVQTLPASDILVGSGFKSLMTSQSGQKCKGIKALKGMMKSSLFLFRCIFILFQTPRPGLFCIKEESVCGVYYMDSSVHFQPCEFAQLSSVEIANETLSLRSPEGVMLVREMDPNIHFAFRILMELWGFSINGIPKHFLRKREEIKRNLWFREEVVANMSTSALHSRFRLPLKEEGNGLTFNGVPCLLFFSPLGGAKGKAGEGPDEQPWTCSFPNDDSVEAFAGYFSLSNNFLCFKEMDQDSFVSEIQKECPVQRTGVEDIFASFGVHFEPRKKDSKYLPSSVLRTPIDSFELAVPLWCANSIQYRGYSGASLQQMVSLSMRRYWKAYVGHFFSITERKSGAATEASRPEWAR